MAACVEISSGTSGYGLGVNVEQLVTYAVRSKVGKPSIEVLDVHDLPKPCHRIACQLDSKSIAFAQLSLDQRVGLSYHLAPFRESPSLGIWVHKHHVPSAC